MLFLQTKPEKIILPLGRMISPPQPQGDQKNNHTLKMIITVVQSAQLSLKILMILGTQAIVSFSLLSARRREIYNSFNRD